ncbi:MAG: prepilin-type N-terminal cleavage/methylation domain-containing protein [Burkholderiales bacterium]
MRAAGPPQGARPPGGERRAAPLGGGHPTRGEHGFTLIELLIALGLVALMSSVLFGSLRLAGRSVDAGEAKAEANSGMRLAGDFLRSQLASQHPQRMRKMAEFPLLFGGTRDELRFAAPLPGRVGVGGMWYYKLSVGAAPGKKEAALVLDRVIPDLEALDMPRFNEAERSVLADDIKSIELSYYGRDKGATLDTAPTWRGSWEDTQQLPLLIQIEVTPRTGPPWPPLIVMPRATPEAGCRAWDTIRQQCVGA